MKERKREIEKREGITKVKNKIKPTAEHHKIYYVQKATVAKNILYEYPKLLNLIYGMCHIN